jgi:hypothetical protein
MLGLLSRNDRMKHVRPTRERPIPPEHPAVATLTGERRLKRNEF